MFREEIVQNILDNKTDQCGNAAECSFAVSDGNNQKQKKNRLECLVILVKKIVWNYFDRRCGKKKRLEEEEVGLDKDQ